MWFEHFKAWLRGDVAKITNLFQLALADLEAHIQYITTIADNQAAASRSLAERSKALYADADAAAAIKAKLTALVS